MIQDPDSDLVKLAKAKDKAAFSKLVEKYYDMVYSLAYGVLSQRESALDATQEVFFKVFREIERFEGKSKFKTWLYRVSVNMAIDFKRRVRPADSIDATDTSGEDDEAPLIILDSGVGPRDGAIQKDRELKIRKALEGLSEEHRAILILREWQDLSYEEIAEVLSIEVGTVMSRLFYARKKLGEVLKQELQGEIL